MGVVKNQIGAWLYRNPNCRLNSQLFVSGCEILAVLRGVGRWVEHKGIMDL